MKIIEEIDYGLRFPKNDSFDIYSMDIGTRKIFLNLYSMYRKLFTDYIIEQLDLKKYDIELKTSELNFIKISEDNMDFYQGFSNKALDYIYIRNNLYVERLNKAERDVLYYKFLNNDYILDEISRDIIKHTFKKVIFEDVDKNGELRITNYGPDDNLRFFAQNNSLILGLRYDEFNLQGLSEKEWDKLHTKQILYINNFIEKMNLELSEKMDIPVGIIRYDDFSVKKKQENKLEGGKII